MNIIELEKKEVSHVSGGFVVEPASFVVGATAMGSLFMINRTQRGGKAISTVVGGVGWLAGGALHYTLHGISSVAGWIGGSGDSNGHYEYGVSRWYYAGLPIGRHWVAGK